LRREAKVTADKIAFPAFANATIRTVASDYQSAAGANPVISCFDELWAYSSERARRLFDEMAVPPTRRIACRLTVTYAGFEGESDLLEELYKRGMKQPVVGPSLHAGDGILMFWSHEPVAPWQTADWLAEMRRSQRPNQYLRMVENRWVTTESNFVVDSNNGRHVTNRGLSIWVGVDASVKHDSTAIVAVSWDRPAEKVRLVQHRIFQPSPDDPLNFEDTIEATLLELRARFHVVKVLFDPWQMQSVSQRLRRVGLPIEEYAQSTANLTAASQNLYELVTGGNLAVYSDAAMRLAISRAVAVETARGWRISKEKQSHKVDVVVALAMAAHACVEGQSSAPLRFTPELIAQLQAMPKYRRPIGDEKAAAGMRLWGERRYLQQMRAKEARWRR
jgi:hypothetical protein